jgi:hypothetical protein
MSNSDEPIDPGTLPIPVVSCDSVAQGEVWIGPRDDDPFEMFGPGTTRGGRAEAGWFELGKPTEALMERGVIRKGSKQ